MGTPGLLMVFDAPEITGTWAERIKAAARRVRCTFAAVVPWSPVRDLGHAFELFRGIRLGGGEGLILRHPTARNYHARRTGEVLKMKCCPIHGDLRWPERRRTR